VTHRIDRLVDDALAGAEGSLGRLLTLLETDASCASRIRDRISGNESGAFRIGITGSPGSGKSTLIDKLVGLVRSQGLTVGVICVDPSSPITGGAVLGDRIRMERHYSDEGVFIRSMASRGSLGGIATAVGGAVELFDACGKDVVIVETVGIGQEGVEVTRLVDVTVLVLAPGWGDTMQLMKAGILEVADVIVVNKADLGAADLVGGIKEILSLGRRASRPPVVETQAVDDIGVDSLWSELEGFRRRDGGTDGGAARQRR
jgi:LAO/AO transport system kinase